MKGHLAKMKENQERLQRQLAGVEGIPGNRINETPHNELKYNGGDRYPMEFLKELSELQEQHYPSDNIKWIGRHLEADAEIWWRVILSQVSNFEEFKEAFIQKYWGQEKQNTIRDNLEFGRYNWRGGLNPVQYMERLLLESRQLTPAITDRQLIKKLARHFGREFEVAVVTRGVNAIQTFESLIVEYSNIPNRRNREFGYAPNQEKVISRGVDTTPNNTFTQNKVYSPRQGWVEKDGKRQFVKPVDRHTVNMDEFTNNKATTSSAGRTEGEKKIKMFTKRDSRCDNANTT